MAELKGLTRVTHDGITLVERRDEHVAFAFTERTGGVSEPPYASLNLGSHVGDDLFAVQENRRRALDALGVSLEDADSLLVPNQVHGDNVVCVMENGADYLETVREQLAEGADAVVCCVPHVPVMLCFADCTPVVITCGAGFAIAHSGWKGTLAKIAGKTARALSEQTGVATSEMKAFIGPHILGDEYEVSQDLMDTFSLQFDNIDTYGPRMLDMSQAIRQSLEEDGVLPCEIYDSGLSTMRLGDRFFSYRREAGTCGRHAALGIML